MNEPVQNPPVERLYMRAVVSREGLPKAAGGERKSAGARKDAHPGGGDYLIGLTTFRIRPRPAGAGR